MLFYVLCIIITVPNQDNRNGRYGYQIMAAARSVQVTTINLSTVSEYVHGNKDILGYYTCVNV